MVPTMLPETPHQPVPPRCPAFPVEAPLAVQLAFLGHRVAHLIERRLADHGYTHTQAMIVAGLTHHPYLMAQHLAGLAHVEPPSATRALQALERRRLVRRRPHPTDGRASLFELTPAGGEAAATIARLWREASAELEAGLPPEEAACLRTALAALSIRIEQLSGASAKSSSLSERTRVQTGQAVVDCSYGQNVQDG